MYGLVSMTDSNPLSIKPNYISVFLQEMISGVFSENMSKISAESLNFQ